MISVSEWGDESTVFDLTQSRVTTQKDERRHQRKRRREWKQKKGSDSSVDDDLSMKMRVWSVHEPNSSKPEEGCEPEQINSTGSVEKDRIDG